MTVDIKGAKEITTDIFLHMKRDTENTQYDKQKYGVMDEIYEV